MFKPEQHQRNGVLAAREFHERYQNKEFLDTIVTEGETLMCHNLSSPKDSRYVDDTRPHRRPKSSIPQLNRNRNLLGPEGSDVEFCLEAK